jgi:hypothetical protein
MDVAINMSAAIDVSAAIDEWVPLVNAVFISY